MAMQAQPARPVIDTQALADLTHDSEKTSIVLEVVSQTKPGSEMHLHANWVAISLITTLQTIYRSTATSTTSTSTRSSSRACRQLTLTSCSFDKGA